MRGDLLLRLVLRCCAQPFRQGWADDIYATYRESYIAVRQDRGRAHLLFHVCAELIDLLRSALRSRIGSPLPITGGVRYTPPEPKDSGVHSLFQDFSNASRRLIREPRAAMGAILLLALAIGVTSAMFAIVDAFIVRPAPFRDPATLVQLDAERPSGSWSVSFADARTWRDSGVFEAVHPVVINASGEFPSATGPVNRSGARITPGTFAMLGISPMMGREFVRGEGREGNERYVILSAPAWRELYASDPMIVGKTVEISKEPVVVVGVMPDGIRFPHRGNGIWRPLDADAPSAAAARSQILVYARRKSAIPEVETQKLASQVSATAFSDPGDTRMRPASAGLLDDYSRQSIQALAVGVGLVFVVLCANVTNLIMARTTSRRQEFGVCSALGASRARLLRQVFLENVVIGICATGAGLALASALVVIAENTLPEDLLWRTLNPLDLDYRTVVATAAAGMFAVLIAGLPSAWLGTRADASESLRLTSRGGTDTAASRRLSRGLLILEVAMAVALLASAGLQVRSFLNLTTADRGLASEHVLIAKLKMPEASVEDATAQALTASLLVDRLSTLPGVAGATRASNIPPNTGSIHFDFDVQTQGAAAPIKVGYMRSYYVAPHFFDVFGIDLLEGRGFEMTDDERAAVVSETLAAKLFGEQPRIGQSFSFGKQTYHIVGVSREIRNSLTDPREDFPEFYSPWYRVRVPGSAPSVRASATMTLGIRCADPCATITAIRQAIEQTAAAVTVTEVYPLSRDFLEQLSRPRAAAIIAALFAGLALFATAAGLYGVLAYVVSRRRREFGIRAALGAQPHALRRQVLADGVKVTAIGVGVGVAAGWALQQWIASVQFGVVFFDPYTWAGVVTAVILIAIVAAWRPASDAMSVDPSEMLREP